VTTFEGPPVDGFAGIGALTMGGFLDEVAARFATNEAMVFDDPLLDGTTVRWSYAELLREAQRIGRALVALGVDRGERVGILMGNRPEAVAALFGAAMVGAVAVPLSTFAPKPELAHMLETAEVAVVLTQDRLLARRFGQDVADLAPALPHLRHVAVLGAPRDRTSSGPGSTHSAVTVPGQISWGALLARADEVDPAALRIRADAVLPEDDALIIFSSGTTSAPKGMLHGHRAPTQQFWVQSQIFGRHERTRMWCALPLFWTAGLNTAMGSTLAAGGCWVVQETFDPGEALALIERERVTEPYTLPHQTALLEEHPAWPTTDLSSLTCVYGKSAFARHPSVVHADPGWFMPVGYGLSETCAFFASHWSSTPREVAKQSIGRLLPGNQLRVIDPATGAPLGVGQLGELAVKGPTLMRGYLGRPFADSFDADGFFHSGDEGSVDADGYVHFEGRRTEMIKTAGANVSPAELEVQLRACPPVKLARIVGIPDPRLDQVVVACITLKDGEAATEADIQAFLRDRVAAYKVPKRVLFFADGEIPMTTSATKVRDEALVALVERRLAAEPVPHRPAETTAR
jgi:acyl-CoA synthetase (AMP-forming)/AMP-acid ligase II